MDAGAGGIGPDGEAVAGYIVVSRVSSGASTRISGNTRQPDLELFVPELPDSRNKVELNFLIYLDVNGRVVQCNAQSGRDSEFSAVACEQTASLRFPIKMGRDGEPIPYIRSLAIDFLRSQ